MIEMHARMHRAGVVEARGLLDVLFVRVRFDGLRRFLAGDGGEEDRSENDFLVHCMLPMDVDALDVVGAIAADALITLVRAPLRSAS